MPRKPYKRITIRGPLHPGELVPKPPGPAQRPKAARFYNWPAGTLEPGERPVGEPFVAEVAADPWHKALVAGGVVALVPDHETAARAEQHETTAELEATPPANAPKGRKG